MRLSSFLTALFFVTPIFAENIKFSAANGKTEYTAVGRPAMIKINGRGEGPEGDLKYDKETLSGTLAVDLNKFTTDIDLRDDHMKNKYLEVQKYPKAQLIFKDFKVNKSLEAMNGQEIEVPFKAELNLKDKLQTVNGTALLKKTNQNLNGEASFSFKIMNHLDTLPSYAGVKVAEDVKVKIILNGQIIK